jgi:PIN domain nuclease of toxin-antitoxin system
MSAVVVDTHSLLWYINDLPDLSTDVLTILENAEKSGESIYVPSIIVVELRYLVEKGRDITEGDYQTVIFELKNTASAITIAPLSLEVAEALSQIPRSIVPDMPDRIIAATALALNLPLITKDNKIRQLTNISTVW